MTVIESPSMLVERQWLQPGANWLNWDQAPFFFSPQYLSSGVALREHVRQRLRLAPGKSYEVGSTSETCITVDCDDVRLTIDARSGILSMGPSARDIPALSENDFDPVGRPNEFLKKIDAVQGILPRFRAGVFALTHAADLLASSQRRHLSEAFRLGHAAVVGRWHQAREPFRIIHADQWRLFSLDWPTHDAPVTARAGDEVIYSPMVMPIERPVSAKELIEREAEAYLLDRYRGPNGHQLVEKMLRSEISDRWPEVVGRAFQRVNGRAKIIAGPASYKGKGRPSKNGAPKK